MVKVSDLKSASQIADGEVKTNPAIRHEVERTALANAVAIRVIEYRADHDLSQTQLARQLGMHQSAIARLEAGDHEPSLSTLARLAKGLGTSFGINITPDGVIELDPVQQEPVKLDERMIFQLYLRNVEAVIQMQQSTREAVEQALASQRLLSGNPRIYPGLRSWFLTWLKTNQARGEEDNEILEELERLLNETDKPEDIRQGARQLQVIGCRTGNRGIPMPPN